MNIVRDNSRVYLNSIFIKNKDFNNSENVIVMFLNHYYFNGIEIYVRLFLHLFLGNL